MWPWICIHPAVRRWCWFVSLQVAVMNSLTVNLHLLFVPWLRITQRHELYGVTLTLISWLLVEVSFYRPNGKRNKIMYEEPAHSEWFGCHFNWTYRHYTLSESVRRPKDKVIKSSNAFHLTTRLLPLVQITLPSNHRRMYGEGLRHILSESADMDQAIIEQLSQLSLSYIIYFFTWWFVSTPMLTCWNVFWIIGATCGFESQKKDRHQARLHGLDPKEVLLPIEAHQTAFQAFLVLGICLQLPWRSMSMFPISLILSSLHFQWFLLFVELSRLVLVRNCSERKTLSQQSKSSPRHFFQIFFPAIRDGENRRNMEEKMENNPGGCWRQPCNDLLWNRAVRRRAQFANMFKRRMICH